jgi:hypothetical protein
MHNGSVCLVEVATLSPTSPAHMPVFSCEAVCFYMCVHMYEHMYEYAFVHVNM